MARKNSVPILKRKKGRRRRPENTVLKFGTESPDRIEEQPKKVKWDLFITPEAAWCENCDTNRARGKGTILVLLGARTSVPMARWVRAVHLARAKAPASPRPFSLPNSSCNSAVQCSAMASAPGPGRPPGLIRPPEGPSCAAAPTWFSAPMLRRCSAGQKTARAMLPSGPSTRRL